MTTIDTAIGADVTRSFGHVALNYRNPDDGPLARRFVELLGFTAVQDFPLPQGGRFYQMLLDPESKTRADGILYMAPLPQADRDLYAAIHERLGVGSAQEDPVIAPFRAAQASDPEYGFHVGFLASSLEWIEEVMATFADLAENDPDFRGRINLLSNRSRPGTPEVDARLDASPIFGKTPRFTYGRNAVQAFIETDIFSAGPLGDKLVFELDYVFPGYPDNMFTVTEL